MYKVEKLIPSWLIVLLTEVAIQTVRITSGAKVMATKKLSVQDKRLLICQLETALKMVLAGTDIEVTFAMYDECTTENDD